MTIEEDLEKNVEEFLESAEEDFIKKRYNSAIGSYFKAFSSLCDLEIYKLKGILPKNHSERFFFLNISFKEVYKIMSSLFDTYTKIYNLRLELKDALIFKENVKKIRELLKEKN